LAKRDDNKRLLQCLGIKSEAAFRDWHQATLNEKPSCISHKRESYWSEAIAVGYPDGLQISAQDAGLKQYSLKNRKIEKKNTYIHFLTEKN